MMRSYNQHQSCGHSNWTKWFICLISIPERKYQRLTGWCNQRRMRNGSSSYSVQKSEAVFHILTHNMELFLLYLINSCAVKIVPLILEIARWKVKLLLCCALWCAAVYEQNWKRKREKEMSSKAATNLKVDQPRVPENYWKGCEG